ncbi:MULTISPECIES: VWA domain-containing protein [Brevibacillus]|uniref:VWA domain-containing protein n=1 Tax=Brevibacillus TaxID=55080 RepID=UPI0003F8BDEB|nr:MULTISPECIES: VWA domain-containing protein [Brevibacillus]MDR9505237.1 hypothetical protein [Brevibacillus agri]MED1825755.1 hypothetical protein [Brevibacillus agri]QHZ56626.1 hypothetical protein M655_013750 [Brevibacillus sp. NSP2.1]
MIVRASGVERYLFETYLASSRTAQEWVQEAQSRAEWFNHELLADFFLVFYVEKPEIDMTQEATPFHHWMIRTLMKQYFTRMIHPRTVGNESAAFKTAIKALLWLTETFAEEVKQRQKDRSLSPLLAGLREQQGQEGTKEAQLADLLTEKQKAKLELIGYTLQQGKRVVEDKQEALDTKPLVRAEIAGLQAKIEQLREEMSVQFTKRTKLMQKVKKLEEELAQREKQLDRLQKQEKEAIDAWEKELGQWLEQSLKGTLSAEDVDTLFVDEVFAASQRFANRSWGHDLGKLRRQSFEQYVKWVEKLKRHPDLVAFLDEVGRQVHRFRVRRKEIRSRHLPEEYYDLRQSGDIAHMLPGEAVLLADPDYEHYFMLKWLEQKLMTYDTSGWVEEPPKGPVICMLDTSHSMRGAKLRLAQIFIMTFAALSMLEKRDFVLILFGAKGELREQPLYHKKPDWGAFYGLAQMAFGGGTHFDAPMKRAMELVETEKTWQAADLVMVTDGVGGISPYVQEKLVALGQKKQVRLHSLIVGSARQHLVQTYDLLGISHRVRFATSWETEGAENTGLLLDVFGVSTAHQSPTKKRATRALR